jgi:dTDP-4-dehydrorhamnose reductase
MLRLARERPEIRVVDDQIGSPTYAGFLAEATACIIGSIETDQRNRSRVEAGELLHLSNDGATSWHGFAAEIFAQFAARFGMRTPRLTAIATKDFPTRARRPANSRLSIERARNDWSLSIPYWQASLTDCFMREGEALAAQLR